MYECPLCKENIKTVDDLDNHIRRKHNMHYTSEAIVLFLKAMRIRDEELKNPKKVIPPKVVAPIVKDEKVVVKNSLKDEYIAPAPKKKPTRNRKR